MDKCPILYGRIEKHIKHRHFTSIYSYTFKQVILMKMLLAILISFMSVSTEETNASGGKDAYCVMAIGDQTIMEEQNMHRPQSVASISKIMTAIVALENSDIEETWQVSDAILSAHGSAIYLKQGQDVSMKSLLYGLMLRSGNDAAAEIAAHTSGSEKKFVKLMNKKAKEIGMLNTIFHNPSGLDDEGSEGNISTAYDMAVLMSYAMKNKQFRDITSSQYYTSEWNLRWKNKNKLLFEFPFTTGGKTGFTKHAGRTLVTTAKNHDLETVVVTLGTADDFEFHKEHHTKAFNEYEMMEVLSKGTYHVDQHEVKIKKPIKVTMKKDKSDQLQVNAHIEKGELIVEVKKNNQLQIESYDVKNLRKSWWEKVFS